LRGFSEFTDASGKNEMYDAIKNYTENEDIKKEFIIFDDERQTVWICWCEEALM